MKKSNIKVFFGWLFLIIGLLIIIGITAAFLLSKLFHILFAILLIFFGIVLIKNK